MSRKLFTPIAVLTLLVSLSLVSTAWSVDYQHSLDIEKMNFSWSVNGDKLDVKLSAPTTGWVAVGFNPSKKMKDADIIIGYVKKGKVTIKDEFGSAPTQHKSDEKIGGTSNVTVVGGSEENGVTTIEFSIPLNSGDTKDSVIDPAADTVIIVGYGTERDSFKVKHVFRDTLTVNLASGQKK
ncbi:DOMON domain-containing protein [Desulfopila sp. IMCC35008]|uniref:DOMON domain-containing protein n=1 Tax=Desulfopila sp. IMCC35008 TaxID=2653858 RepID=UPI0013D694B2|nr:DOMON domain-containing protein [Desulfopila sp. IMCC35008]